MVWEGSGITPEDLAGAGAVPIRELLEFYEFSAGAGEIVEVPARVGERLLRLAFVGTGDAAPSALRAAGVALARHARGRGRLLTTLGRVAEGPATAALIEGLLLPSYRYTESTRPNKRAPVAEIQLVTAWPEPATDLHAGRALVAATELARDLINTPAALKSPSWFADQAAAVAADTGLQIRTWDESALRAEGFGGILAVGQGSPRPPRLIELRHTPDGADRHVVLVGKGITFDTGGLSLKPNDNMKLMKTDMAGAAAVLGAMAHVRSFAPATRVTALLAMADNAFSGAAQRPSDVITHFDGRTVEILNTDAEGRLVLADAIAYAVENLRPDRIIDVATLTGAARIALGGMTASLFSTDDELADELLAAADHAGEHLWRMPITDEYRDTLDSAVADLTNIGIKKDYGRPGAIEAALFLREFTAGVPWAHLDIAGPGRSTSDEGVLTKGGTGYGTRLVLHWLAAQDGRPTTP
ncbi:leucyl aminopeptidase [Allonocardiopsis opalescens]|uniref:leucyl aminopeptidase n=1 Tax=Allonocardiopsis opalescens TaxID=1144618 RepID=UPI001FE87EDB|nr:leucyl aminopeptidase [Allonocardiopsis opalescens]